MKIGFIGVGNMASAIIKGIVAHGFIAGNQIIVYDHHPEKLTNMVNEYQIHLAQNEAEVIDLADYVLFAVKPNVLLPLIEKYQKQLVANHPVILSIAAGTTLAQLEHALGDNQQLPVIRIMPNVNAMVGLGCAAICGNTHATKEQLDLVLEMFNAVGKLGSWRKKTFQTLPPLPEAPLLMLIFSLIPWPEQLSNTAYPNN